jgi:hypothetical protein
VCTPLGAGSLFTVLSQLLVGPQFLRNLEEEHRIKFLEVISLKNRLQRKIKNTEKMRKSLLLYYEKQKRENEAKAKRLKGMNGADKLDGTAADEIKGLDISGLKERWDKMCSGMGLNDDEDEINEEAIVNNRDPEFIKMYHRMMSISAQGDELVNEDDDCIRGRIKGMEDELGVLGECFI